MKSQPSILICLVTSVGTLSGFGTLTTNSTGFATGADFSSFLAGINVLVVGEYNGRFLIPIKNVRKLGCKPCCQAFLHFHPVSTKNKR